MPGFGFLVSLVGVLVFLGASRAESLKQELQHSGFNRALKTNKKEVAPLWLRSSYFRRARSIIDLNSRLEAAVLSGQYDLVEQHLGDGANVNHIFDNQTGRYTPLVLAMRECHRDIIRLLLEKGAEPYFETCGYSLLQIAYDGTCPYGIRLLVTRYPY